MLIYMISAGFTAEKRGCPLKVLWCLLGPQNVFEAFVWYLQLVKALFMIISIQKVNWVVTRHIDQKVWPKTCADAWFLSLMLIQQRLQLNQEDVHWKHSDTFGHRKIFSVAFRAFYDLLENCLGSYLTKKCTWVLIQRIDQK